MAILLSTTKKGNSVHICVKQEICKKLGLKHGDIVIAELVEIEKDILGKTLTVRYGEEAEVNALLLKKNNITIV